MATRTAALVTVAALALHSAHALPLQEAANSLMAGHLGWSATANAPTTEEITLTFAVAHEEGSEAWLEELFGRVSDPRHSDYGAYVNRDDLRKQLAPAQDSMAAVVGWLNTEQVQFRSAGTGDLLRATMPVSRAGELLGVKVREFKHAVAGHHIWRTTDGLQVPPAVEAHLDFVGGLSTFPNIYKAKAKAGAGEVTPATIKQLYNLSTAGSANSKASQALAEFQGQGFLPSDLAKFQSTYSLPAKPCRNVSGDPKADKTAGTEASLDVQYIVAAAANIPTDFYLLPGNAFDLLGWVTYVEEEANAALVWSVSYGEGVNGGNGGTIKPAYAQRLDVEFKKLAVTGITVLFASGDSGVYDRIPFEVLKFHPSFPACLPSVTAVGATQLTAGGAELSGVSFSGGGFSPKNYFTRANATWQSAAVEAYFTSGVKLPAQRLWERTGRGIPDVSAVGVDFAVFVEGRPQGVSGTSASTPVVAGILSLLNDVRLSAGKPPLGFANPFLYQNQDCFNDILQGHNNGGGLAALLPGFYATKGWDPVTGLGTPDFAKLKAAALK